VVPADIPLTIPEPAVIVALAVTLLVHVPPAVASFKVTVLPTHTWAGPVILLGEGITVKTLVTEQPLPNE